MPDCLSFGARVRRLLSGLILGLGSLSPAIVLAAPASDQEQANQALKVIVNELNQLDRWLNDAERKQAGLQKDLAGHDQRVAEVSRALASTDKSLREGEQEVARLQSERDKLERQKEAQASRISLHINAAYRLQRQDVVRAMLNDEAPADMDRMLRYHRYFSDARMESVRAFQSTLHAIAENEERLGVERSALEKNREELLGKQTDLDSRREERTGLIRQLAREVADKSARQKQLSADRQRLERLLAELARRSTERTNTDFRGRRGSLPLPVAGSPVFRYGAPRADGRLRWEGMVYRAGKSAPVHAVHRGTIVFANWLRGFGMLAIIDHGNGFLTLYGYVDGLNKNEGDAVESGEVIAYAGQSGGQPFDGVYFEIRHKGIAIDPRPWLRK
jgi:murein hydrolase activator